MVTPAYSRSVAADTKKKSGKSKGSWYDLYRVPAAPAAAAQIVLAPRTDFIDPAPAPELIEVDAATGRPKPVIVPYYKVRKHKHKVPDRSYPLDAMCTAGWDPHNKQPCCGCYAQDCGDRAVSLNDYYAFPMVHLAYYHRHPMIDRQRGGIAMKQDNSGPVMIETECGGRTCNFCRVMQGQPPLPPKQGEEPFPNYNPRDISTVFGKRRYMELGKSHLQDITGIDVAVSSLCGRCRSTLTTVSFYCPNCNSVIIDMATDPRDDEQIAQEVMRPYPCMKCQKAVLLKEYVVCERCQAQNQQLAQITGFDVVLSLRREGEGTHSHIVQAQPYQTIEEIAQQVDPRFFNGKATLREHIAELAKPYDFEQLYKAPTLQEQSERLKLAMPPSATGAAGQQFASYPGQQAPMPPQGAPPQYPQGPQYPQAPSPYMAPPQAPQAPQAPGPLPFVPPGRPNYGQ